jgi:hypothetical protein
MFLRRLQVEKMQQFHRWYGANLKMRMNLVADYSLPLSMDLSRNGICGRFNRR